MAERHCRQKQFTSVDVEVVFGAARKWRKEIVWSWVKILVVAAGAMSSSSHGPHQHNAAGGPAPHRPVVSLSPSYGARPAHGRPHCPQKHLHSHTVIARYLLTSKSPFSLPQTVKGKLKTYCVTRLLRRIQGKLNDWQAAASDKPGAQALLKSIRKELC